MLVIFKLKSTPKKRIINKKLYTANSIIIDKYDNITELQETYSIF